MSKRKPMSEETKKKLSEIMKGRPSHFKGRTYEEIYGPERAKELSKIRSVTFKELWEDEEYREKMKQSQSNREPMSEATKKKISDKMKGRTSHFKNRTYVEIYGEERAKELSKMRSESLKGREFPERRMTNVERFGKEKAEEIRRKHKLILQQHPHPISKEARKKMSIKKKEYWRRWRIEREKEAKEDGQTQ